MAIKIKCKCGKEFTVSDPGEKECPKCGVIYTVTESEIKWSK